ncbi:ATP-binding cassette domain-containing protein [Williamsia deligens]|uniref:ATP-binding cassette domain-containing protein n=1 Tax=Williamsia deligens TaxID=321325 RepID=A0ABW3G9H2_9NOCA|nr:ABC transporter ATP-binding protein [Williamsia deligens]MCP2192940.1 peptide/nickel transport system ATP-binding protein [Williamsia deligens]
MTATTDGVTRVPDTGTDESVAEVIARVANLGVSFGGVPVVHGVDLHVRRGEVLAIVGESGSGKSVTTRALAGLAGPGAQVEADAFDVLGSDPLHDLRVRWDDLRGRHIGLVLQDALTALDPLRTIRAEIGEALRHLPRRERAARAAELLTSVGVPDAQAVLPRRAFQLSGGQRQRALIASAVAAGPELLIADEPTTALDVTVQAQVLALLVDQAAQGRAVIVVSHDLAVVSQIAHRVVVMHHGRVVEEGPVREVIDRPAHSHTRSLLAAVPRAAAPAPIEPTGAPVVEASDLTVGYRVGRATVGGIRDVSFAIHPGEVLGVVGESGSGKSTVAKVVTGLLAPQAGSLRFRDDDSRDGVHTRPGEIGLVAQDSLGSFDPRYDVGALIGESVATVVPDRAGRRTTVLELLDRVHLPASVVDRHPRELSGGQRQRVNIARAIASRPRLLVCDEPVSALDISVQAQILTLLGDLASDGLAVLFISHDLAVVRQLCHRTLVLDAGQVVESGPTEDVFRRPRSDRARALLAAIPSLEVATSRHTNTREVTP